MFKPGKCILSIGLLTMILCTCQPVHTPEPDPESAADGIVRHWAVLMEKDQYDDVGMSNLPVDFISLDLMETTLIEHSWKEEQIHTQRGFDRQSLEDELTWLQEMADGDDMVLLYLAGHGRFFSDVLRWEEFFPYAWQSIQAADRVLILDACEAGKFIRSIDAAPAFLGIGSVDIQEYGWCGLEEEGLPIIGFVFTHFFTTAFSDPIADQDNNERISLQEASLYAEEQQRAYMHDVVFAIPEFAEGYHKLGIDPQSSPDFPHIVLMDSDHVPVYLEATIHTPQE